jgi:hypothetical protein
LILDFEFDQHLESHKHVISIIMGFRDTGCYTTPGATSPGAGPMGSPPPINVTPLLSIEASNSTAIPLL